MTAHEGDSQLGARTEQTATESATPGDIGRREAGRPEIGHREVASEQRLAESKDEGVVRDVAVKDISPAALEPWSRTQHGYSEAELRRGLEALPKVKELLKRGYGREQFAELGRSSDEEAREIARTYAAYYGDEHLVLDETTNGPIEIENGTHRVDLAQRSGIEQLPAEVRKVTSVGAEQPTDTVVNRELERRQADAAREWRQMPGSERAAFGREVGREEHREWQAAIRRSEAARGRVEGKHYAIEHELLHPDGTPVRYDYVDFAEDRIVDHKPQHASESDFDVAKRYVEQQRRHIEAYQARFGRTPIYEYAPYSSSKNLYREP